MTNRQRVAGLFCCLTYFTSIACNPPAGGRELHVAAAANLRGVLDDLSGTFQANTGIHVISTIGSTAQLAQQIENGAPVDLFLAADTKHVDDLVDKGIADRQTRAIYARGQLVLWAPSHPEIKTLRDLASPQVREVGCARPELAPYGAAAVQALKREGLWPAVEPKLVYGQSISSAKQFADSGNAAAAFTALSLLHNLPGHYVLIAENLHDPLDQALCIVKQSSQPALASQFREFILSAEGKKILARFGYN